MLAHVDMLLIESVHSNDPASGGYTPANSVPANGRIHWKRNRGRGNHEK
ncbi:hypothetical protein SLEP1_g19021 [Rubroshorea leprosula]|nr:hypothetical protein SLEP1_g19021 [Rubroshorea leprosula]